MKNINRWFVLVLLVVALVVLAITARWWLPSLLTFVGTNSDLIQGATDLIQLVLWVVAGITTLVGFFWRRSAKETSRERTKIKDSTVATHDSVAAGQVAVRGDVHGDIVIADPDLLWQAIRRRPLPEDLRQATKSYLTYLVDRYRYLDFKGMGVSDRVPLRLPLVDMYVDLKARVEMPEGETWTRQLHLAGRKVSDEEQVDIGERLSKPQPVLSLLQKNGGLIILGDPGSGKTTFLKYLALRLATGSDGELGLAKVRLPVLVPLSAYANALAEKDVRLDDFIARYLHNLGTDLPVDAMLEEALKQGGVLVLLDGLDEVKDPALRQTVVDQVLHFYTFHRQAGNRFLLTSRIVGYRQVRPVAEGLAECTLVDFGDEEIEVFTTKWTSAMESEARGGDTLVAVREAERERQELAQAISHNPGVRGLAANPLLLTILALMKRQGITLPERRVELYDQYVRTLLSSWNRARGLGRPPTRDLDVMETVRILAPLALWMHEVSPGVGLVKQGDLRRKLIEIYQERGEEDPERAVQQFMDDVRGHAALLLERGAGQYGFIHLTFEEYLAAVGITRLGQRNIKPIVDILTSHVGQAAWREVSLLTIGHLGVVQQWEEVSSDVVKAILKTKPEPGEPGQAAVLAGEAVADAWPGGVTSECKQKVVQVLVKTLQRGKVKPPLRAAAGRVLARLGDPRPGVGVTPATGLPDIIWCEVPAGPFLMGDENLQYVTEEYRVSRYPITNAQYAAFVEAKGYQKGRYWTKAGWMEKKNRAGPDYYREPFNLSNHPVVGVSWYEAIAFCRWLTEQLRQSGELGSDKEITLPTEPQWEKAARGTDGRIYPWGNDPDPNCANYNESNINATSAVGCFPNGISPYGIEDLSGNVREWCRTKWEDNYENYQDDNDLEGKGRRVVRGGAFYYNLWDVRCAVRFVRDPYNRNNNRGFRIVASPVLSLDSDTSDL
ncbi:MAG: SUMF1/EgtB/PvdO family nonheme iron enzyme [Chloroflexi bacterium]|nr:SUMF1/EgtB/PvdO family nonheme iron enzyme [Chloroflexota bacterium]